MTSNSTASRPPSVARMPSLDGLRAWSIFLVMGLHTSQHIALNHHVPLVWYAFFNGGVDIFFVISGYLITKLLLIEHQKRGSISLSGFYLRRATRILPPLYAYIVVIVILGWAGRLILDKTSIITALFFFHNYVPGAGWHLEHFWSLSLEEQFYFIWPFILILCLRRPGVAGRILAARVAIGVILASPFVRVASFLVHNPYIHNGYAFHIHADTLMFGCALALLEGTPRFENIYRSATRIWWIPPAVAFVSECLGARFQHYWTYPVGFTIWSAAIAFFLLWCVRNPMSPVGRFLNARFIAHIGVLSYSMYLWQTLFLHDGNAQIFGQRLKFIGTFPVNWIVIVVVAELSRRFVELPSLRLRERLMSVFHVYAGKRNSKQLT